MSHHNERIICWLSLLGVFALLSGAGFLPGVLITQSSLPLLYQFCAVGFWASYLLDRFNDTTTFSRRKAALLFFGFLGGLVSITHSSLWHWQPSLLVDEFLGLTLGFWGEVVLNFLYFL